MSCYVSNCNYISSPWRLYRDALGIELKEAAPGYLVGESLEGVKHFALWPLAQAAESCFGKDSWPSDVPVPQAWIEFEVESVEDATAELESRGYRMLIAAIRIGNVPVDDTSLEADRHRALDFAAHAHHHVHLVDRDLPDPLRPQREPWGQTVSRFLSPEGLLVGITFTPWMRDQK